MQVGIFLMTACTMPMFLLSGFFIHLDDLSPYVKWLSYVSIFRYALEASTYSIFGSGREPLECSEEFCPYNDPRRFLKDMGLEDCTYWGNIFVLCIFIVLSQIALFTTLKRRVAKSKER
uniref:ABC-2 type transporter transmembrane domain-containing protein n=1 Tax=Graphocephala atropunctata TaxID=36148 RepID=A0A1B6KF84_9HEMI